MFLLVLALMLSCATSALFKDTSNYEINYVDKGFHASVSGNELEIELEGNPTTGYSWVLIEDSNQLFKLEESEYEPFNNVSGLVGGGGKFVFEFDAVKSGTTSLSFAYKRPWESESIKAVVVLITVDKNLCIKIETVD